MLNPGSTVPPREIVMILMHHKGEGPASKYWVDNILTSLLAIRLIGER